MELKFDNWVVWPLIKPNNEFDVAIILLIDNKEFVDKLFKLLNIVVEVEFKWLIDVLL